MLGVLADHHDFTFSLDDLALFADLLNGWFYLHCSTIPFLLYSAILFCSPSDAALGQVIDRNLNGHTVTGQNFDIIHTKLAGNVGSHDVTVRQLDLEAGVRQCLNDCTFKLDNVVLLCPKNPSLTYFVCVFQKSVSICVRIKTPSLVSATVFS